MSEHDEFTTWEREYLTLTDRQSEILDFIENTVAAKGYPPTVREIGDEVGLRSPSTTHAHLATLQRRGWLVRDPSKPRAIQVVRPSPPDSRFPPKSCPHCGGNLG